MRNIVRALLVPVWWINQIIGGALDRLFPDVRESVGYFVTARKP